MSCRSGARSAKACEVMNELGIENINLTGGILAGTEILYHLETSKAKM
jgi:rhodanese-related sulfurtransferase